jgi:single-strand DNA-binding protein
MSLNRAILIGRLTRRPELRITPSSVSVTTFTLAVDRPPTKDGAKETDFLDCVAFGRIAENTCKYMDKGRLVAVDGRLQRRLWEAKDGQKRHAVEVIADNVQFLDKPKSDERPASE